MKKLIYLLAFLSAQAAHAKDAHILGDQIKDWSIFRDDYGYHLVLKMVKTKSTDLETIGPFAELLKVELPKEAPHIALIEYNAGTAGTSVMATAFRAAIFDLSKQVFIGDAPMRVELSNGQVDQSKWTYQSGGLTVEDDNYGTQEFKF